MKDGSRRRPLWKACGLGSTCQELCLIHTMPLAKVGGDFRLQMTVRWSDGALPLLCAAHMNVPAYWSFQKPCETLMVACFHGCTQLQHCRAQCIWHIYEENRPWHKDSNTSLIDTSFHLLQEPSGLLCHWDLPRFHHQILSWENTFLMHSSWPFLIP